MLITCTYTGACYIYVYYNYHSWAVPPVHQMSLYVFTEISEHYGLLVPT